MEINGVSILVVDDEESIREFLINFLELFDAKKIFIAKNGIEAIRIMFNENINLIIFDKDMPKMSGIELLEAIRNCNNAHISKTPVIIMSGYDIKQEAEIAGADAFLQKPFTLSKLREVIEKL